MKTRKCAKKVTANKGKKTEVGFSFCEGEKLQTEKVPARSYFAHLKGFEHRLTVSRLTVWMKDKHGNAKALYRPFERSGTRLLPDSLEEVAIP